MIKGKYVALVEIDFSYEEENLPGVLPFDKIKQATQNDLSGQIAEMIQDEVSELGMVKVTQQYVDLYKVEAEHEAD